jgi:hypothetical protein
MLQHGTAVCQLVDLILNVLGVLQATKLSLRLILCNVAHLFAVLIGSNVIVLNRCQPTHNSH